MDLDFRPPSVSFGTSVFLVETVLGTMVAVAVWSALPAQGSDRSPVSPLPPPEAALERGSEPVPTPADPAGPEWSLESLEQLALAANPTLAAAAARVAAARGRWWQAARPPNLEIGYMASEVGNNGHSGQQGGYLEQTFVTGGKLSKAQYAVAAEVQALELQFAAQRQRVLTDVRARFFAIMVLDRRIDLTRRLLKVAEQAMDSAHRLLRAGEVGEIDLVQARIEARKASVELRQAEIRRSLAWQSLAAAVGVADLAPGRLLGDLDALPSEVPWRETLAWITSTSPAVHAAGMEAEAARRRVTMARAKVVPDVTAQVSVQADASSQYTIAGIQAGVPLPLWNRYRGDIREAQAQALEAERRADATVLQLQSSFADVYRRNATARLTVAAFREQILPDAERALALVMQGYDAGERSFLELLTTQRTYVQNNLAYLDALAEFWEAQLLLEGFMLDNGFGRP